MLYSELSTINKSKITRLLALQAEREKIEGQLKTLKSEVQGLMSAANVEKIEKGKQSVTLVQASTSLRVDTQKLRTLYSSIYEECSKEVNTSEHLKVKC